MKPLFRRSKKTLADSKSLERIRLLFRREKRQMKPFFRSHPLASMIEKKLQEIRNPLERIRDQISTRGKIDKALLSFSSSRFNDRKKILTDSKSPRKNRVIISTKGKIDEALVSTIEKKSQQIRNPLERIGLDFQTRGNIDEVFVSFSPLRFDDRKKTLGNLLERIELLFRGKDR